MIKSFENHANVEKLINLVADNQKFAKSKDKLTSIIDGFSGYLSEELDEEDLELVVAAKMPEVPKYKQM